MRVWMLALVVLLAQGAYTPQSYAVTPVMADYADLVETLSPAVVNVATKTKPKKINGREKFGFPEGNPFAGTPFEEFFQQFGEGLDNMNTLPRESLGSGVVISADGYVVTNNHVVDGADEIVVKFNNPGGKGHLKEYSANVVGRDSKNDLSLLKIDAKNPLPFAQMGDSDALRVGQAVLAIGNPFGLGGTVTSGIVSAMGRNIGQGPYDDFIQTDAAINPGNSGGPLFNAAGEVVGINSAIFTRSGGSNGIGFAIPVNTVKLVVGQLKQYGHPVRGWLGVKVQQVTEELAQSLNLKDNVGALVAEVVPESPAAKAGMKVGDVIVSFNGQQINEMADLPRKVAAAGVGSSATVNVLRDGKPMALRATITQLEEGEEEKLRAESTTDSPEESTVAGLDVAPLTANMRQQLDIPSTVKGVVIQGLERGSVAAESGLQRGDIIAEADWMETTTVQALREAVEAKKGRTVLLRVYRADGYLFVPLKVQ